MWAVVVDEATQALHAHVRVRARARVCVPRSGMMSWGMCECFNLCLSEQAVWDEARTLTSC